MRTIIEKVTTTGGFLQQAEICFSKGLNCVIGSRGTCKSTLVESIRFAFDVDPDRIKAMLGSPRDPDDPGFHGLIQATLGSGSVRCEVRDERGDTLYSVERDAQSPPRIYREGVKDHIDTSILNYVELYSQGDLQRIAEKPHLRLRLIDRPHQSRILDLRNQQFAAAGQLNSLGARIRATRAQIEQLHTPLRALPELQAQLQQLRASRPELSGALAAQRALFLKRQAVLQSLQRAVGAQASAVEAILQLAPHRAVLQASLEQLQDEQVSSDTGSAVQALIDAGRVLTEMLDGASVLRDVPLSQQQETLRTTFEGLNERYYQLRQQEQDANESLKKEDVLKQQIEHLDECQQQLDRLQSQLHALQSERSELRHRIRALGEEIFQIRSSEVDGINQRHGQLILLTLEPGASSEAYVTQVKDLLQGSRLRGQDEIGRDLATLLTPAELIDIVESGDTPQLTAILGRDIAQTTRLMSFLLDNEHLYELEGYVPEDSLSITMFDNGQPKPVQALSKGQKATALLPLILREAPYPLIFDQPEDDLDNRFIFKSLVRTILELKSKRQLIFITHNANIPVIGEAETVVVMRMDGPSRAGAPLHGSVDERQKEIIDLLEGGASAFMERHRRYHDLLTEDVSPDAA